MEIIENEFLYLVNLWNEYKVLFGNENNLNILNKNCGDCFHTIQHSMNNDMILSLNRLLDPSKQHKNTNLVLESLLNKTSDSKKRKELEDKLEKIRDLRDNSNLKEIRNQRLAHSDITTRNKDGNFIVILIEYDAVDNILHGMSDFLNNINSIVFGTYVEYLDLINVTSCQDLVDALDK